MYLPGMQILLPTQTKVREFAGRGLQLQLVVPDVSAHTDLDGLDETIQFVNGSLGDNLDAPVGQIANEALDVKSAGKTANGITKADPLNLPPIINCISAFLHELSAKKADYSQDGGCVNSDPEAGKAVK